MVYLPPTLPPAPVPSAPNNAATISLPVAITNATAFPAITRAEVALPIVLLRVEQNLNQLLLQTAGGQQVRLNIAQSPALATLPPDQLAQLPQLKNLQLLINLQNLSVAQLVIPRAEWRQLTQAEKASSTPSLASATAATAATSAPRIQAISLPPALAAAYGVTDDSIAQVLGQNAPASSAATTPAAGLSQKILQGLGAISPATKQAGDVLASALKKTLGTDRPASTPLPAISKNTSAPTPPLQAGLGTPPAHAARPVSKPELQLVEIATNANLAAGRQTESAVVVGQSPKGEPIVRTATTQQILLLSAQPSRPLGDKLQLLIQPSTAFTPDSLGGSTLLAKDFPALHELLSTLAASNPEIAARVQRQLVPSPGAKLGSSLLFLLHAVGATPQPGNAMPNMQFSPSLLNALPATQREQLVAEIKTELQKIGTQTVPDQAAMEWRSYPLPVQQFDGLVGGLNFYVQQRPDNANAEGQTTASASTQTRFLLDLQFTQLGHVQLEGLWQTRQLDLILRSEVSLPAADKASLSQAYASIIEATGLKGMLKIEDASTYWLRLTQPHQVMARV